jgi:hypothetical protein
MKRRSGHSLEGGNPWIPAYAGMTRRENENTSTKARRLIFFDLGVPEKGRVPTEK